MAISSDNVSVTISVADKAIDRAGFGVPLILGPTQAFPERTRLYAASSGLAAMLTDGFAATDPEYLAASALLAQNPRMESFKIGRRAPANVPDLDIDFTPQTPVEGEVHTINIDGQAFSHTSDATPTVAEITAALETAINAASLGVTATDNTTFLTIEGDTAGDVFDIYDATENFDVDDNTADASVATELAAVAAADNDWYGLILASHSTLENAAAASWAESNSKLFICTSSDTDILSDTAGNLLETLNGAAYNYTAGVFTRRPGDFFGAAWMASRFAYTPGTASWKFVNLSGVTADNLTASQIANIRSNKGNYYTTQGGLNITSEGWAASGRFLDTTRFIDWLTARISENVFSVMANAAAGQGKIPFTDAGINQVVAAVEKTLQDGVQVGGLSSDPAPVVTFPRAADVSAANKAARTLPDIDFSATLAGAVHKTTITGKVTV